MKYTEKYKRLQEKFEEHKWMLIDKILHGVDVSKDDTDFLLETVLRVEFNENIWWGTRDNSKYVEILGKTSKSAPYTITGFWAAEDNLKEKTDRAEELISYEVKNRIREHYNFLLKFENL